QCKNSFHSTAKNRGSPLGTATPHDLICSISEVAVCCSRASFSSRVRAATCSWRSAVDGLGVFATLDPLHAFTASLHLAPGRFMAEVNRMQILIFCAAARRVGLC